jgi:hypothetical protein
MSKITQEITSVRPSPGRSTSAVSETRTLEVAVIPAKAGIQSVQGAFPRFPEVDSRFRGNDPGFVVMTGGGGVTEVGSGVAPAHAALRRRGVDSRFRGNDPGSVG